MSPRALAAALHRHHNEDEYSWIIEGRVGALLGDEVLTADLATSFSSHGANGIHSGTRAMSPPASLRLFPPQDLSSSSTSFLTSAVWTRYRQRP